MTTAFAPGKIILFGEHAVVYGRPAIAVPVFQVRAEVAAQENTANVIHVHAPDIGKDYDIPQAESNDPIASIIRLTCNRLGVTPEGITLQIHSTIPVARGLGSGAAVSIAIARAIAQHYHRSLDNQTASVLAYEVEKLYHGTPSGVDNTTIAFGQPVYFVRNKPLEFFKVGSPFLIAIADTGINSPTKVAVGDVREAWEKDRVHYERLFDQIGALVERARRAIQAGDNAVLGPLMNENQTLAREMGVSSTEIDTLVTAALQAGADGAKLSGAGRGGNVIALVREETRSHVERSLLERGAKGVIVTRVE